MKLRKTKKKRHKCRILLDSFSEMSNELKTTNIVYKNISQLKIGFD